MPTMRFSIGSHFFAEAEVNAADYEEQHDDSDVDEVGHNWFYEYVDNLRLAGREG